jgi:hypothetical protein
VGISQLTHRFRGLEFIQPITGSKKLSSHFLSQWGLIIRLYGEVSENKISRKPTGIWDATKISVYLLFPLHQVPLLKVLDF